MYDYKESKKIIENILNSSTTVIKKDKIPSSDDAFTYENGIRTYVSAIFVDIVDSSTLFKEADETTARIMRCFCSEIISILKDDSNYREIGIRGDCVYAVFSAYNKDDLVNVFNLAVMINTFMNMLNKLLKNKGFPTIEAGIGLGFDDELVIKAGKNGSGINDKIWIGNALVDAAHLSDKANRNGIQPIAISKCFYNNIIELLCDSDEKHRDWIKEYKPYYCSTTEFYHCNIVYTDFSNWIKNNFNEE